MALLTGSGGWRYLALGQFDCKSCASFFEIFDFDDPLMGLGDRLGNGKT